MFTDKYEIVKNLGKGKKQLLKEVLDKSSKSKEKKMKRSLLPKLLTILK